MLTEEKLKGNERRGEEKKEERKIKQQMRN